MCRHFFKQKSGMGSLRTVLDLEDSSRTKSRGLGLEGSGLGLEHSVLEHIPARNEHTEKVVINTSSNRTETKSIHALQDLNEHTATVRISFLFP